MPRFFVPAENISNGTVIISGENVAHIGRVLRMNAGDALTVCDGERTDFYCEITEITKKEVVCRVLSEERNVCEPEVCVTLFQGLPKGSKMDYIIQKCVEMGVFNIVPFISTRCVARGGEKTDRYTKISIEAAKQCGRGIVPKVLAPISLEAAFSRTPEYDLAIFAYEGAGGTALRNILRDTRPKNLCVFIGPEGGFDEAEVRLAKKSGCKTATLGNRILRTETAGMAVISNIMYEYGI